MLCSAQTSASLARLPEDRRACSRNGIVCFRSSLRGKNRGIEKLMGKISLLSRCRLCLSFSNLLCYANQEYNSMYCSQARSSVIRQIRQKARESLLLGRLCHRNTIIPLTPWSRLRTLEARVWIDTTARRQLRTVRPHQQWHQQPPLLCWQTRRLLMTASDCWKSEDSLERSCSLVRIPTQM